MKSLLLAAFSGLSVLPLAGGDVRHPAEVDPERDLPRLPAVEAADAVATWKVKRGFRLELVAHEPQVRDPIAVTFDENGRMFVCEMIDYSERRDASPHLGRISLLEDTDGDGFYETSRVFADGLPWPTGLIWANGGLFVGATPNIWRFEDRDGDGRAEVRERIFTGFGTGLARLNVQTLLNSFQWGQDNRIHVQSSSGNRGRIRNLKRPDLPEVELAARDFWFDPLTYEHGFEAGGAQYGMSFDNYGRKFASSNSDHLQFWVYDDRYARNPFFELPAPRQSIAADGGAAEVFRLSPDEPWRIIRTRWRIGGVVRGIIEGGGRVSGYFTGATGTTVYRGDAYGPAFVNNTFTGDAGGQLVHRKIIEGDGVSLVGRRPADEQGMEFAASTDSWVRVVNFANAPDGTLYVCDMYREVIEHPASIPDEIKQHLNLNSGNERGRIYRIAPIDPGWKRRQRVALGRTRTDERVALLEHPNGWHRDTASRLLYERQDESAAPLLQQLIRESRSPLARHHALGVLDGLGALDEAVVLIALGDPDARVRERGIVMAEKLLQRGTARAAVVKPLAGLSDDPDERVRFQFAFTVQAVLASGEAESSSARPLFDAYVGLARRDAADPWLSAALLSGPPEIVAGVLFPALTADVAEARRIAPFVAHLVRIRAAMKPADEHAAVIDLVAHPDASPSWIRALGEGLSRAGTSIEEVDSQARLVPVFARAAATAGDPRAGLNARIEAIELLAVAPYSRSRDALIAASAEGQPDRIQTAAVRTLALHAQPEVTEVLLRHWPHYRDEARDAVLAALVSREDRTVALLEAVQRGAVSPAALGASRVQSLVGHPTAAIASLARTALAPLIPPSREAMAAAFRSAVDAAGDAQRGREHYLARCSVCHRAGEDGKELGPDFETVKNRGRESLLTAILDPHKEVAPQYIAYDIHTKDGSAYTGIITRDEARTVSLKIMGGVDLRLPRSEIEGSTSSGRSLMPEGLEAGMTVQDMADLLVFIEDLE